MTRPSPSRVVWESHTVHSKEFQWCLHLFATFTPERVWSVGSSTAHFLKSPMMPCTSKPYLTSNRVGWGQLEKQFHQGLSGCLLTMFAHSKKQKGLPPCGEKFQDAFHHFFFKLNTITFKREDGAAAILNPHDSLYHQLFATPTLSLSVPLSKSSQCSKLFVGVLLPTLLLSPPTLCSQGGYLVFSTPSCLARC